jgi:hypothetical protein
MDETAGPLINNTCNVPCGLSPANAYDLTAVNTPTFNQSGINAARGTSIFFDSASSEYAEANANDTGSGPGDTTDFTTGCWAKTDLLAIRTLVSTNRRSATTIPVNNRVWSLSITDTGLMVFTIAQATPNTDATYSQALGATVVSDNTWHFYVATWVLSTTTNTVYLDGVQDGTSSTTSGSANSAVEYMDLGVRTADTPRFLKGYLQDCFIIQELVNPITLYCVGTGGCGQDDWPYNVKAPEPPKYQFDKWLTHLVKNGYTTGLWAEKTIRPRTIGAFLPFAAIPWGPIE